MNRYGWRCKHCIPGTHTLQLRKKKSQHDLLQTLRLLASLVHPCMSVVVYDHRLNAFPAATRFSICCFYKQVPGWPLNVITLERVWRFERKTRDYSRLYSNIASQIEKGKLSFKKTWSMRCSKPPSKRIKVIDLWLILNHHLLNRRNHFNRAKMISSARRPPIVFLKLLCFLFRLYTF